MGETVHCAAWGQFDENTYVVGDAKRCVVIDPGAPPEIILPLIDGRTVNAILLTHTHLDHIFGVDELRARIDVKVYAPINEERGLEDPMINLSGLFGMDIRRRPADATLSGGARVEAGSIALQVRDTPGHSPGHLAFVGDGFVIAGDTLFSGSIGRTDLPGSSHARLIESIRTQLMTLSDTTVVYPGHGPRTTIGTERRFNPFFA